MRIVSIVPTGAIVRGIYARVKAACAGLLAKHFWGTLRIGNCAEESLEKFFGRNALVGRIFLRVIGDLLKFSVCSPAIRPPHSQG